MQSRLLILLIVAVWITSSFERVEAGKVLPGCVFEAGDYEFNLSALASDPQYV